MDQKHRCTFFWKHNCTPHMLLLLTVVGSSDLLINVKQINESLKTWSCLCSGKL
uniref:Uncharacterized protein n=1 Tax=Arundo donax TaxID=35708 RepID=A0A0A9H887_ARUDO